MHGDADRPFDVLAGSVKVTVVGTQFAVRHTAGSPVQVAVQEGQVRVSAAGPSDAVLLTAGQQVQADGDGRLSAVGAVPPAGIAPWRDGRVSFDNVPLSQALAEFERYGPTRLAVRDPAVAAMRLSGTFDPRRLDNFRKALPKVLPVRLLDPRVGKARRPHRRRALRRALRVPQKFFTGGLGFCRAVRLPEKDSYSQPSGDFPHAPFQFHFHSRLHSRFRPLHPVPLALATALLLATMAAPSRAQSQAPLQALPGAGGASAMASVPVQIRIASQPLAQALDTLARQARLELMVQPALVEGRTAPAVEGRLSASGHGPPAGRHRPVCGNRRQRRHRAAHAPGAATGSLTLAPVNVSAKAERSAITEGSESLAARAISITKGDQALKDIPQSVSVLTRRQLDDQGITDLRVAANNVTGTVGVKGVGQGMVLSARGFQIDAWQYDGVAIPATTTPWATGAPKAWSSMTGWKCCAAPPACCRARAARRCRQPRAQARAGGAHRRHHRPCRLVGPLRPAARCGRAPEQRRHPARPRRAGRIAQPLLRGLRQRPHALPVRRP